MPTQPDVLTHARQAGERALALITSAIERAEAEVEDLREHARRLSESFTGRVAKVRGRPRRVSAPAKRSQPGQRVDWAEVLASLPRQFSMPDVLKHRGAAAKGKPQIYVAIARWESLGRVKRLAPGKYRKVLRASKGSSLAKATAQGGRSKKTTSAKVAKKRPAAKNASAKKRAARSKSTTRTIAPAARSKKARAKTSTPQRAMSRNSSAEQALAKLPSRFGLGDLVQAVPEFAESPPRAYLQLAQWTRSKRIKKVGQGQYQRL